MTKSIEERTVWAYIDDYISGMEAHKLVKREPHLNERKVGEAITMAWNALYKDNTEIKEDLYARFKEEDDA